MSRTHRAQAHRGGLDLGQVEPDDPVAMFTRLVRARQIGDAKAGVALTRRLREVGWSVVAVAPREPWGGVK